MFPVIVKLSDRKGSGEYRIKGEKFLQRGGKGSGCSSVRWRPSPEVALGRAAALLGTNDDNISVTNSVMLSCLWLHFPPFQVPTVHGSIAQCLCPSPDFIL